MTTDAPINDPTLSAQGIPALGDTVLPQQESPWSWVPSSWNSPIDQLTQAPIPVSQFATPQMPAPEHAAPVQDIPVLGSVPPPIAALPSLAPQAPDALTGAGGLDPGQDFAGAPIIPTRSPDQLPEAHYAQTLRDYADNPLAIPDEAELDRALATLPPAELAVLKQRHDNTKLTAVLARKQEAVNRDWEEQQRISSMRSEAAKHAQERVADLLTRADTINQTRIDPTGGVEGGRAIAGILAAVIGGLVQGKTGSGRNAGMDELNKTIDRGIAAQQADLASQREGLNMRKSLYAQEFAVANDAAQAADTIRLAALKHADDLLSIDQQNFDPRGSQALERAALRQQIAAAQQKVVEDRAQKSFDNSVKLQDAARQQQLADEARRHNLATEGIERAKASAAQDKGPTFTPEQWKFIHPDNPVPPVAMSQKDYGAFLEARVKGNEIGKVARERTIGGEVTPVTDAKGNVTGRKLGPITMADGTPFQAKGTEPQVTQLEKQHVATVQLLGTLDEIRRIGPEWLSDTANTDKLQRLKQLMGSARLQSIAANNLGVPTGHDIELAEDFIGTTDPTRRKDSLAGIMSAREALVRNHNIELKAHGLDKDWDPPDLVAREKKPQPGDLELEDAMRSPFREFPISRIAGELGLDPSVVAGTHAAQRRQVDAALEATGGMLPSVKNTIDTIAADLLNPDLRAREAAAAKLGKIASAIGAASVVRDYASQLLTNSIAPNLPQVQESVR